MIENGQGNEHRPTPRRHFVDAEEKPLRHENHLHGNGRKKFPWKLTEEREIQLGVSIHLGDASKTKRASPRLLHPRLRRRVPRELQSKVSLDRGVDFAGTILINVPSPVGELSTTNMGHTLLLQNRVHLIRPVHKKEII